MTSQLLRSILASAGVLMLAATVSYGQQAPAAADPMKTDTSGDDILLLVNVTAKELRFDTVPSTNVQFPGTPKRTTIWVTDRQNLPDKVEPGVTYRNIGIQLRISSRFEDIERIVREALGEDEPTKEPEPPQPPSPAVKTSTQPAPVSSVRRPKRK